MRRVKWIGPYISASIFGAFVVENDFRTSVSSWCTSLFHRSPISDNEMPNMFPSLFTVNCLPGFLQVLFHISKLTISCAYCWIVAFFSIISYMELMHLPGHGNVKAYEEPTFGEDWLPESFWSFHSKQIRAIRKHLHRKYDSRAFKTNRVNSANKMVWIREILSITRSHRVKCERDSLNTRNIQHNEILMVLQSRLTQGSRNAEWY